MIGAVTNIDPGRWLVCRVCNKSKKREDFIIINASGDDDYTYANWTSICKYCSTLKASRLHRVKLLKLKENARD